MDWGALAEVAALRLPPAALVAELVERARVQLGSEYTAVLLADPDGERLVCRVARGLAAEPPAPAITPLGPEVAARIVAGRGASEVERLARADAAAARPAGSLGSFLAEPLLIADRFAGIVYVAVAAPRRFSAEERGFLSVVAQWLALAVESERLAACEIEERLAKQQLELLVDQSPLGIIEWDAQARVVRWNAAAERIFGYPAAEVIGRHAYFIVPPEARAQVEEVLRETLEDAGSQRSTNANQTRDGRTILCDWYNEPLADATGKVVGIESLVQDVTERRRIEQALQRSEERYRSLFEDATVPLWEEDLSAIKEHLGELRRSGVADLRAYLLAHPAEVARCIGLIRVVDVNRATLAMYGAGSKAEFPGRLTAVVGPESYPTFVEELVAMADGRTRFAIDLTNRTLSGEPVEIEMIWVAVPGHEETLSRVIVSTVDMTERKRTERALRESEERFRATFEQAAVGFAQVAVPDGRLLRVNEKLCEILGYSREELARETVWSLADSSVSDFGAIEGTRRLLSGEIATFALERQYRRKDGASIWLNVTLSVMRDDAGAARYLIAVIEDISPRKAAALERERLLAAQADAYRRIELLVGEAERRAAELRGVLDNMVEGVYVVDSDQRIVLVNQSGIAMFGFDSADRLPGDIARLAEQSRSRHLDGRPLLPDETASSRALAGEVVASLPEIIQNQKTGRDVYVLVSGSPIHRPTGEVVGAVMVIRDVTEIGELDRLKDQFIAVAAHELKTPVTIMKGYAQTLLRTAGDLPEARRRMLEAINRGADRIDAIIINLLDIARLSRGQLDLSRDRFSLTELVAESVDHFALTSPRHEVRVIRAEPALVHADRPRIEEVIANLLDNAIRYSPAGGLVTVAVDVQDQEAFVSVRDQGVGIPALKQAKIFQRFFRAHTQTPFDYGGMGVGLFISREIVKRHGGRMWFESREGVGSTFHFSLPLDQG